MPDVILIPARYGSSRFPGKPLALVAGRSLIERTIHAARLAVDGLDDVTVAVTTDDERIARHAADLDCPVVMTPPDLPSGTDRVAAAAASLTPAPGIVINLQGDAPFTAPEILRTLLSAMRAGAEAATPVVQLSWEALDALRQHKLGNPFSGTCCIRAEDDRAIWFSKAIVPALRGEAGLRARMALSPVWRHVGVYAFRLETLKRFSASAPTFHETLESIEALRFIELGIPLTTVAVDPPRISMSGIDTEGDIALAERLIALHGDPMA
ncbi:3-deoxy-manno-octulosonate cytidylyltransferase [Sphingomonas naphthae]|uniref:3-deoxy-manno-octulosonate cytidylyltransferase n=1 Tax=Sphingomonas naphthae TaxID=1813468 RepID=A0ABY7TPM6_9SPHN|nr:3-deoxy-manno-octulosonate cytidylyltransferase [Sphingomonas naphthae]WCT75198.1 3-deoxy-manno-octulosonate cytidylyltransferase [Sphingomonas naphthae]